MSRKRSRPDDSFQCRVFPPEKAAFQAGERVLWRVSNAATNYARALVLPNNNAQECKVQVSEHVKTISREQQSRCLLPDLSETRTIIVTPETVHFRQLVAHVNEKDQVLEIGCSSGETSRLLIQYCQTWVGLDTSQEMLQKCHESLKKWTKSTTEQAQIKIHTALLDPLVDPRKGTQEASTFGDPNVIFLDIGGNRECINVLRMLDWVLNTFDPRLVVIKSRELVQSLQQFSNEISPETGIMEQFQTWWDNHRPKRAMPKHPLKAALVMSPTDPEKPICRYYNYHINGCKKDDCALDHEHCHACLKPGHRARDCDTLVSSTTLSNAAKNNAN